MSKAGECQKIVEFETKDASPIVINFIRRTCSCEFCCEWRQQQKEANKKLRQAAK
jgi:hypothetical protein